MAVIGGFRSDTSMTRKTDGKFGNDSAGVLYFQSRVSMKTGVIANRVECTDHLISFHFRAKTVLTVPLL